MNKLQIIREQFGNIAIDYRRIENDILFRLPRIVNDNGSLKLPKDFLKINEVQEIIKELEREGYNPHDIVYIKQGGVADQQGTWVCEELFIRYAMWASTKFGLWSLRLLKKLFTQGQVNLNNELESLKQQNKILLDKMTTNNLIDMSNMSYDLGLGRNTFMKMLREDGYLYKNSNKDYNRITMKGRKYLEDKLIIFNGSHRKIYVNKVGYEHFFKKYTK